jgi:hypothetical protein
VRTEIVFAMYLPRLRGLWSTPSPGEPLPESESPLVNADDAASERLRQAIGI